MTSTAALFDWLEANAHDIRWDIAAGQAWDELTWCSRRLEDAVDNRPARVFAGYCGAAVANGVCGRPLYRVPDADVLRCDGYGTDSDLDVGCRARHDLAQRKEWLIRELDFALVTLDALWDMAPKLLPKPTTLPRRDTMNSWIRLGHVKPHGYNDRGEPLYVGGELLARLTAVKPRRWAPKVRRVSD